MQIDARSPSGNAFYIMASVRDLLRQVGRKDEWPEVQKRMMAGDYATLCAVAYEVSNGSIEVVNIDSEGDEDDE